MPAELLRTEFIGILKKKNIIRRMGPDFGGFWEIIHKNYA